MLESGFPGGGRWPRDLEAASLHRPWTGGYGEGLGNSTVLLGLFTVRRRSRHASVNSPWMANGIASWVSGAIGTGITPASAVKDDTARAMIGEEFGDWVDIADSDGLTDFFGLQSAVMRGVVVDGEAFVHMISTPDGLRLCYIPAETVDISLTMELQGGSRIVMGIEFDSENKRVAYHIRPMIGALQVAVSLIPAIRVPAEDICHVFKPIFANQVRGIPWASPILLSLNESEQLQDAMLMAAKISAMMMGFVTDQNSTGSLPFDGDQHGSILKGGLEPGTLKILPAGWDVKFSSPAQITTSVEIAKLSLRAVAAGLGVPEYLVSGDMSQANYSSLRAALVEFRRRVEQLQHHTLVPQLLRPVWRRWLVTEILAGRIDAPGFEDDPESWFGVSWYPPPMPWVEPLKDAEAEVAQIAAGLKSRRQAVAERGFNIEQLDEEIAADKAREKALGLVFTGITPTLPTTPAGTVEVTQVKSWTSDGRIASYERFRK